MMRRVLLFILTLWTFFSASLAAQANEDLKEILRMAEHGSRPFQYRLYELYESGEGVDRNSSIAFDWLERAAEGGYGPAQETLGVKYLRGQGVRRSFQSGLSWLTKAAENQRPNAQYLLGRIYAEGKFLRPDPAKAREWLLRAIDNKYPPAMHYLAHIHCVGGSNADLERAQQLFLRAAEEGYAPAQQMLGRIYTVGGHDSKNPEKAEKWLRRASDQGNPEAQNDLGVFLSRTPGITLDKVLNMLKRAAAQGNEAAQHNLWLLHQNNLVQAESDRQLLRWVNTSAKNGNIEAQSELGDLWAQCESTPSHLTDYACRRIASYWHSLAGSQTHDGGQLHMVQKPENQNLNDIDLIFSWEVVSRKKEQ